MRTLLIRYNMHDECGPTYNVLDKDSGDFICGAVYAPGTVDEQKLVTLSHSQVLELIPHDDVVFEPPVWVPLLRWSGGWWERNTAAICVFIGDKVFSGYGLQYVHKPNPILADVEAEFTRGVETIVEKLCNELRLAGHTANQQEAMDAVLPKLLAELVNNNFKDQVN